MLATHRLTLGRLLPAEALRIVRRTPGPDELWHPEYPLEDDLDPLRALATSATQEGNVSSQRVLTTAGCRETAWSQQSVFYSSFLTGQADAHI